MNNTNFLKVHKKNQVVLTYPNTNRIRRWNTQLCPTEMLGALKMRLFFITLSLYVILIYFIAVSSVDCQHIVSEHR